MVARLYIGSSAEPDERLKSHNFGRVCSTKPGDPGSVFYLKNIQDRATAEKRRTLLEVRMGPQGTRSTFGEVAEWLNAAVLKTAVGLAPTVGSNPTLSGWDENFSSTALRASAPSGREAKFAELAAGEIIPPSPGGIENFSSTALRASAPSGREAKFAELAAGEIIPPSPGGMRTSVRLPCAQAHPPGAKPNSQSSPQAR